MDALAARFERFLAAVEPGRQGRVVGCEGITGGYSRISSRARVRWRDGAEETFILRGDPPRGSGVFASDRDAEWELLRALPAATSVSTPVARWYDSSGEHLGSKAIVMECAPMGSLQDEMARADDVRPLADLFADTVAAVHGTRLDRLPARMAHPPDWSAYLDGVLANYDRVAGEYPSSAPVLRYVTWWARRHEPPPVPLGLVHGDCQPSNVLVGPSGPPLVIDWEFGHIGDPREDLGYYTQIPLQPNVYWADPERFLRRYRAATGLTQEQVNPQVVDYFLIIGMAALFEQLLAAAAAAGAPERPGILATYLINAISHQHDMFLAICDRLSLGEAGMITRPTTEALILDCCRELTDEILPALTDETLRLRLIMTETVLRNAAVRAAHEIAWMQGETSALMAYAAAVEARHGSAPLRAALAAVEASPPGGLHLADVADRYERAGQAFENALAAAQEAGAADLIARARELLRDRIATEKQVMASYAVVGR